MLSPAQYIKELKKNYGDNLSLHDALILGLEIDNLSCIPYEYLDQFGILRTLNKQQYILSIVQTLKYEG
jgi:hypothetical protein